VHAASPNPPQGGGVVLTPSDSRGNELNGSGYFEVTAVPGSTTTLYALVGNVQHHKVGIDITPVDARSGVYGGVSYDLPQQRHAAVGAWIATSLKRVALAPQKATVVTLTLHVPAGTSSGQYVGGVTAYVPTTATVRGSGRHNGAIQLQLRRVVAVVVTVLGPAFGRFSIGSVKAKHRPDAYYLITHIHNTGTMLLKGQGHLWVWRQGVRKALVSSALSVDTTLPHTTVHYPLFWSRNPPPGTYRYNVVLAWNGGRCTKTGVFVIR
jgi:hypothetical protein